MEADGAPFTSIPLSLLMTSILSYSYTDQRKVETDIEVTEDQTGHLLALPKQRTNQLSNATCSWSANCCHEYEICVLKKKKKAILKAKGFNTQGYLVESVFGLVKAMQGDSQ